MKMKTILGWSVGVLSAVTLAALTGTAAADQNTVSPTKDKEFTGKVDYVNGDQHLLKVRGFLRYRTFDLGKDCLITRWDDTTGNINDLRRGQKVSVGYQNVHGVLAADRVEQTAMRYSGVVKVMDPERRQLVMHAWDRDRTFVLAEDCKIVLHDQNNGALASIKPGDHVTVVYEAPSGADIARQIAQTSVSFTGSIVAIDLSRRTISADGMFGVKQFNLANNCSIVMDGRTDAPMMNLRPGQRLTINYDEVNGVDVANRIAPAEGAHEATTAQANP
jgi:hypothetical protein